MFLYILRFCEEVVAKTYYATWKHFSVMNVRIENEMTLLDCKQRSL